MPYAEKRRREREPKVNDAEKCCKVREAFTKESLVETFFSEIKLSFQQKNHQAAMPRIFFNFG